MLLLKMQQALVQGSELGLLVAVLGRGLVQPALGLHPDRRSTGCAFDARLQALARLGQTAGRTFLKLPGLVALFEIIHLLLALLHMLLCPCPPLLCPLTGLLLPFTTCPVTVCHSP